jgi:Ran GTPase-activating protein (RanGAP) involved in mRNA processing and transport
LFAKFDFIHCITHLTFIKTTHVSYKQLNLAHNSFGAAAPVAALCTALRSNRVLTALDLSYNSISAIAMLQLTEALADNKPLQVLSLEGNPIGAGGAQVRNLLQRNWLLNWLCQLPN